MNAGRARVRMLLGRWGGWTLLLKRLRREQRAARDWLRADPDNPSARDLLDHINREIADLLRLRETLGEMIVQLPVEEQRVLMLRYESGMNWLQISIKMNYDERSVRRIETRAVDKIGEGLGEG